MLPPSSSVVRPCGVGLLLGTVLLFGTPGALQAQVPHEAVTEAMTAYLDRHPDDVRQRRKLADRLVEAGRIDAAIAQLERLLKLRPSHAWALRQLAKLYEWSSRPADALPLYERLLRLAPRDTTLRHKVARRYAWQDQQEASIRHLELLVDQAPDNRAVRRDLVEQYRRTNQTKKARVLLQQIIEDNPADGNARQVLANLYFWDDRPAKGIQQLEWIVQHDPHDLGVREQLAQHYFWTQQPRAGIRQLEWIVSRVPTRDSLRYELAQRYFQHGQSDQGLTHLRHLVHRHPTDVSLRRELARHYQWSDRTPASIQQRELLLVYDPSDTDTRRILARQLFWENEPMRGLHHLRVLVQQSPDDRSVRSLLARRYAEHGQTRDALEQYRWLVEHPPTTPDVKTRFLQHLLWTEQYDAVVTHGKRMLEAAPDHTDRRLFVAQALAWSDRSDKALRHVDTLLAHAPDHVDALLLGSELQRWRPTEWPEARQKLKRVLALQPQHERATSLLRDLRRDHGSTIRTRLRYETDSNDLSHQYAPLQTDLWLGGLWRAVVEVGPHRFYDRRAGASDRVLYGYEGTVGVQTRLSTGTTLRVRGTATRYGRNWSPVGGSVLLRQSLGPLTLAGQYQRGELRESITSLRSEIRTHRLGGRFYLQLGPRLSLAGDGTRTWLSDTNRRLDVGATAQVRLLSDRPSLTLRASYRYEDTEQIFPDSRPYWTPDDLTTLSGALTLTVPVAEWLEVDGTYGLSEQRGTVGHDYGAGLRVSLGTFHSLRAAVERFGSGAYAYQATSLQYAYRF